MRKMNDVFCRAMTRLPSFIVALALALGLAPWAQAQSAPSNDSSTTPQVLAGATGMIWGTNVNATREASEPSHYPPLGFPDRASVWYSWTAPAAGETAFNIPVSTNLSTGATLDTVMAVYLKTNTFFGSTFITVTNNDDSGPSSFNSRCTFNAVSGATYYIAVDCWEGSGVFELQWNCATNSGGGQGETAPRSAGMFQFARFIDGTNYLARGADNYFVAGAWDGFTFGDGDSRSTKESTLGGRVTVTRVGGSTGRVLVDYVVTNDWYLVEMHTNVTIVANDAGDNFTASIKVAQLYPYQVNRTTGGDYPSGFYDGSLNDSWVIVTYTNVAKGTDALQVEADAWTAVVRGDLYLHYPEKTARIDPQFRPDATWTQGVIGDYYVFDPLFGTPILTNGNSGFRYVPSAYPMDTNSFIVSFGEYAPQTGTLVFDDFQMSRDIIVGLNTEGTVVTGFYDTSYVVGEEDYGGLVHPGRDGRVRILLSNPRFDPLESTDTNSPVVVTDIQPPTINSKSVSTLLMIQDPEMNAGYGVPSREEAAPPFWGSYVKAQADPYPIFNFERAVYRCSSDATNVIIRVQRTGTSKSANVNYSINWTRNKGPGIDTWFPAQPGSEYAVLADDYSTVEGNLSWGDNDNNWKAITIPLLMNTNVAFDRDLMVQLKYPDFNNPGHIIGNNGTAVLTILFKKEWNGPQAAGAVDRTFNPDYRTNSAFNYDDGGLEFPAMNVVPGANRPVYALAVQPDGRTVIGGAFTALNGSPVNRIARMAANGWPDFSFDPGSGANDAVNAIGLDQNGSIIIGGNFTSLNGSGAPHIARLKDSGQRDFTFNPGTGANGSVRAIALQSDGKILIGGDFTMFNGTNRSRIARLNADGTLDTTFDPGVGLDATVYAIAVSPDGKILIGGAFTAIGNFGISSIARLTSKGALDTTFSVGAGGLDGPVRALALQADGKIVIGGSFSQINLQSRANVARLNIDGQVDSTFDPGTGTDGSVYAVTLQPDGAILIGGNFTKYNESRRVGIARLLPEGPVDSSFMDTAYNQFAGVPNHYANPMAVNLNDAPGSANSRNSILAMGLNPTAVVMPSGTNWVTNVINNVMIGGSFAQVGGGLARDDIRNRANVARLVGGSTVSGGNIGFMQSVYSVTEDAGYLPIALTRTNGFIGAGSVAFSTSLFPSGIGAVSAADFSLSPAYTNALWANFHFSGYFSRSAALPHDYYGLRMQDGYFGPNYNVAPQFMVYTNARVFLGINDNRAIDGNRTGLLRLTMSDASPLYFGGVIIPAAPALGRSTALLQIVDNDYTPGVFMFGATNYSVTESPTTVTVNVIRTNGATGFATVDYATVNGSATNKVDFVGTSGTLSFADGVTSMPITITIKDNSIAEPDKYFRVVLSNPIGLTTVDPVLGTTKVTIVDNDFLEGHLTFVASGYTCSELSTAAVVKVVRVGGASKSLKVQCAATDGSAVSGINYMAVTNTLSWDAGDVSDRYLTIPLIRDYAVTPDLTINLRLFNAVIANNPSDPNTKGVLGGYNQITNAVLTIVNDDSNGKLSFSSATYNAMENAGFVTVTVNRQFGSVGAVSIGYRTGSGTAIAGTNFFGVTNRLTFAPGELSKSFRVPLIDDATQNSDRYFRVFLYNPSPTNLLSVDAVSLITNAVINVADNETRNEPAGSVDPSFQLGGGLDGFVFALEQQPDGRILVGGDFKFIGEIPRNRIARLNVDGSVDIGFQMFMDGADGTVRTIVSQSGDNGYLNGAVIIGGNFTKFNGVNRSGIARLKFDGALDETFEPGSGVDNTIYAMKEVVIRYGTTISHKVLIGGSFVHYNGRACNGLALLNADGTLDTSFDPGLGMGGTNAVIYSLAAQADGMILAGGDFVEFAGAPHMRLVRVNQFGAVDTGFNPVIDGAVRSICVQPDGKIVIGGVFEKVNGFASRHIARLNVDGSLDRTFNAGEGTDDIVLTLGIDLSGKILVGGEFLRANGVTRHRVTRLNPDGTVDAGINFGDGADGFISSLLVQDDGKIILGGGFSTFNYVPSPGLVRIFGGDLEGSGTLEFDRPIYSVAEGATNVVLSVRRLGGTFSINGDLAVDVTTHDGPALSGTGEAVTPGDYLAVTKRLVFPAGETFQTVAVPIVNNYALDGDRVFTALLENYSTNSAVGGQPETKVRIVDDEVGVSFVSASDRVMENIASGLAPMTLVRTGYTNIAFTVDVITTTNGTAVAGDRFFAITNTVTFDVGQTNSSFFVPIKNDNIVTGDQTVELMLTNALGAIILEPSRSMLTIIEDDKAAGNVMFATNSYTVSEGSGTVFVDVIRTNGITGMITVDFATTNATAAAGIRYQATNGTLAFTDGEVRKTIPVKILDEPVVQGNQNFFVQLSNPQGGAAIKGSNAISVLIMDNDSGFGFVDAYPFVDENSPSVSLRINRMGETNSTLTVDVATEDGTAKAGTNYVAVTNKLHFAPGETVKSVTIPILRDHVVAGDLRFSVRLANPAGSSGVQLVQPAVALVTIVDGDSGFRFSTNVFTVVEGGSAPLNQNGQVGTNAVITVLREGSALSSNTVSFVTEERINGARDGVRYFGTNGVLVFLSGMKSASFVVPIINDNEVQGSQSLDVVLYSPSGGAQIVEPSTASLTIVDDDVNLSFSTPTYTVSECGGRAQITVVRTGLTNNGLSVTYATTDGTGVAGVNYLETKGTLIFGPGQLTNSFDVPIVPDSLVDGDKTVQLSLSVPSGGASLGYPSFATLTMKECEGTMIVPAGMALISEPDATRNCVIDSNEVVTVRFGLRSMSGSTTNLKAVLLETGGISLGAGSRGTNYYGSLQEGGHAVSGDFTFKANGTNGQSMFAVLALSDGSSANFEPVRFSFTLGQVPRSFTNSTPIHIGDNTTASPYPSAISVSDLQGTVGRASVTLLGVSHGYPDDINVLLSGPSGLNTLLMSHCGGANKVNNVRLGFDDLAASSLPDLGQIVTGTNKPSAYNSIYSFLGAAPARPFGTNLAVFRNTAVNGNWSLWVEDDKSQDSGDILNGWILTLYSGTPVAPSADLELTSSSPNIGVIANALTNRITVTNYGPGDATGVTLTNWVPAGWTIDTSKLPGATLANGVLIVPIGSLAVSNGVSMEVVMTPTASGNFTNIVAVGGAQQDLNPDNNLASAVINVARLNADLAVSLSDSPDPASVGDLITYTAVVVNAGPSKASGVVVRNVFPDGVSLIASGFSSSSTNATVTSNSGNTIVVSLGSMEVGAQVTNTFVAQLRKADEVLTDTVFVESTTTDPHKANNFASVKTQVGSAPRFTVATWPNGVFLTWTSTNRAFVLESTSILNDNPVWTEVSGVVPVMTNGMMAMPLSAGTNAPAGFYRLRLK